jgi:putative MFS transporter
MTDNTSSASQVGAGGHEAAGTVLVLPGEVAARIDRLPATRVQWELALITQITWGVILSTDGQAARLYPFIWAPAHVVTSFQYSVVYAFQVGIGILIGDYIMGWLADRIGRKPTMMISAVLAGLFIWPFAFVTNYPALVILSIFACLGVGGILATNVVYMTEVVGPEVRGKVTLGSQVLAVVILFSILGGLVPHFMFPNAYRQYLFLLAGLQFLLLPLIAWRLPESPRWLEARGRTDQARRVIERIEERCRKYVGTLPDPDMSPREVVSQRPGPFAVFAPEYRWRTLTLLFVWILGYGGIVYGFGAYGLVFLVARGYSASFVFGLATVVGLIAAALLGVNALIGERIERKSAIIFGAVLFALSWVGLYNVHNTPAVVIFYTTAFIGEVLWLWNMYVYTANAFPTRMRGLGTGWSDGLGHIGAWGGSIISGSIFVATAPLGWILLITIPGALVPGVLVGTLGMRQRRAVLEKLSR